MYIIELLLLLLLLLLCSVYVRRRGSFSISHSAVKKR
jgi:hypothetical protein